jgi:hypothetical protein
MRLPMAEYGAQIELSTLGHGPKAFKACTPTHRDCTLSGW